MKQAYKRYLKIKNQFGWACKIADEFGWEASNKLVSFDYWKENKLKNFADGLERGNKKKLRSIERQFIDWFLDNEKKAQWAREKRIKFLEKEKPDCRELEMLKNPKPMQRSITDQDIQKAKEYPITDLLGESENGKYKCLWHDDSNPSMHYYQESNSLYCFACQTSADSIKLYQKLFNVKFIEAVKNLS